MRTFISINTLLLWVLLPVTLLAQSFCGGTGGFSISPSSGCAPLSIRIDNQTTATDVKYVYDFKRNQTTAPTAGDLESITSHTYAQPGVYTILQVGTGVKHCNDITVKEGRAPEASIASCSSGKVRVTLAESALTLGYDKIEVNWGDQSPVQVWKKGDQSYFEHTYQMSPQPPVVVKGIYDDGSCSGSVAQTTLTGSTPGVLKEVRIQSVEMKNDGKANLIFSGMEGVPTVVMIDQGQGVFEATGKANTSGGLQKVTVENLDIKRVYRFKLASTDFCGNTVESPVVCTIVLQEGNLTLDEINSLEWESMRNTEPLVEYQVTRDDAVVFKTPDGFSYLDKDVKCGIEYSYTVVAIIEKDVRSYSAPITIKPTSSSPEKIEHAVVTVTDDQRIETSVSLTGEGLTSKYDLIVERADAASGTFKQVSPPANQNLQFTDEDVNTAQNSYCYQFSYLNGCGLRSDASDPVCSILLTGDLKNLSWTTGLPFHDELDSYALILRDRNGDLIDQIPKRDQTQHQIDIDSDEEGSVSYQVIASGVDGAESVSNIFMLSTDVVLLVPQAFTPNGDPHNERFEIRTHFVDKFNINIFDRWGSVIFKSDSVEESWDGKVGGKEALPGYYFYRIEATYFTGSLSSKEGSVLLIR